MLLTLYLDEILPKEFGVRKSPFFIFTDLFKKSHIDYEQFDNKHSTEVKEISWKFH